MICNWRQVEFSLEVIERQRERLNPVSPQVVRLGSVTRQLSSGEGTCARVSARRRSTVSWNEAENVPEMWIKRRRIVLCVVIIPREWFDDWKNLGEWNGMNHWQFIAMGYGSDKFAPSVWPWKDIFLNIRQGPEWNCRETSAEMETERQTKWERDRERDKREWKSKPHGHVKTYHYGNAIEWKKERTKERK